MSTTASDSGSSDIKAPEGTHIGRCVRVIDLGTQPGSQMYPTPRHKVLVGWELPDEMYEYEGDERPFLVYQRYTLSLSDKANLCRDLEAWRGRSFTAEEKKGFQIANVLDVPCLINIVHSDDGKYANVKGVMALPKSTKCPPRVNELLHYEIEQGEGGVFSKLSEGIQKTIRGAQEFGDDQHEGNDEDPGWQDDDIPF